MKFTVLGSTGFIGRHLVASLRDAGITVETPSRDVETLRGKDLGHVVYAIGVTGNFRQNPYSAIEAHVNKLQRLMDGAQFDSWLYLSSTRVYGGLPPEMTVNEDQRLSVFPGPDAMFDLSKLAGESLCLAHPGPNVRVIRPSNVYGADQSSNTFLGAVMDEVFRTGRVTFQESPQSSKDYVPVSYVVEMIREIALHGTQKIYNVCSGVVVTHDEIAEIIRAAGYQTAFAPNGATRCFPVIDPTRAQKEFGRRSSSLRDDLAALLIEAKEQRKEVRHG